jgi:hypothetical protein
VEPIQSIIFGYGYKARSGKDTACSFILKERGKQYSIKKYGFADELKREITENALKSGGIMNLFSDGLRGEGCGFLQTNGNILSLPDWVQPEENPDMTDPLCPLGKFRSLLQFWGGEYRRGADKNYWIKKVAKRIADERPEIALLGDLRHTNEVIFCQQYGEVVLVSRPGCPSLDGAAGAHASETELDNFKGWDDVILNNGSLEKFRDDVLFSFDSLMTSVPAQRSTVGVN